MSGWYLTNGITEIEVLFDDTCKYLFTAIDKTDHQFQFLQEQVGFLMKAT
jgi:hypothetical protein